jgi:hypothetical protein
MRRIACWNDLEVFGIIPLTGEACGLGYRILFDVTESGRKIIEKCFGLPELQLAKAWNHGSEKKLHIGSIMLSSELLVPIGIFALLEHGCAEVLQCANGLLLGIERGDTLEKVAEIERIEGLQRQRNYRYAGTVGDRNLHLMCGRTM